MIVNKAGITFYLYTVIYKVDITSDILHNKYLSLRKVK